jgi:hypothetical protein
MRFEIEGTILLVDNYQGFGLGVEVTCLLELANEFDIIVHSDYLASCVGLDVPFRDLPRFIVEEPV